MTTPDFDVVINVAWFCTQSEKVMTSIRNTIGALRNRPFKSATIEEKRQIVSLGPDKPLFSARVNGKSFNHNPAPNHQGKILHFQFSLSDILLWALCNGLELFKIEYLAHLSLFLLRISEIHDTATFSQISCWIDVSGSQPTLKISAYTVSPVYYSIVSSPCGMTLTKVSRDLGG